MTDWQSVRIFYSGLSKSNDPRRFAVDADYMTAFGEKAKPPPERLGFGLHFLDSGAFSLRRLALASGDRWGYYRTKEHRWYLDAYATYVREHADRIDYYANVDVLGNPELTWRNQQYLEREHGLMPVPVVHFGTDLWWLDRYLETDRDLVGIGGLVVGSQGHLLVSNRDGWLHRVFLRTSDSRGITHTRLHGFGASGFRLCARFPWYSVDSTSWAKLAGNGRIWVPRVRRWGFDFTRSPIELRVCEDSCRKGSGGIAWTSLRGQARSNVQSWLDFVGIDAARFEEADVRMEANVLYYEALAKSLPPWPCKYERKFAQGLQL